MKVLDIKGARMPALGLGTFGMHGADCSRAVREAIAAGYRHIDTAQMYGNEAAVGAGIRESGMAREELFVTTKIWYDRLRPDDVRRTTAECLDRLGLDRVDLLLVHWPNPSIPLDETLAAFAEEKAKGHTRHIGVSNFTVALLDEAVSRHGADDLICNQVEYHVYLSQVPVLAALRRHGMALTAYSPVAKGKVAKDPVLAEIGRAHGKTAGQIALRWFMEQDAVAAIPKSGTPERIRANIDIFDFELSPAERARIDALQGAERLISPAHAPAWDN